MSNILAIIFLFLLFIFIIVIRKITLGLIKNQILFRNKKILKKLKNLDFEDSLLSIYDLAKDLLDYTKIKGNRNQLIDKMKIKYDLSSFNNYIIKVVGINDFLDEVTICLLSTSFGEKESYLMEFIKVEEVWQFKNISLSIQKTNKKIKGNKGIGNFFKLYLIDNLFGIILLIITLIASLYLLAVHHLGYIFKIEFMYYQLLGIAFSIFIITNYFLQGGKIFSKKNNKISNGILGILLFCIILNIPLVLGFIYSLFEEEKYIYYSFSPKGIFTSSYTNKIYFADLDDKLKENNNKIENLRIYFGAEYEPKLSSITGLYYSKNFFPFTGIYYKNKNIFEKYNHGNIVCEVKIINDTQFIKTYYFNNNKLISEISNITAEDDLRVDSWGVKKNNVS